MLTKMRPRLARLIGDMDEDEDADGLIPINRDLVRALHLYDDLVHGDVEPMVCVCGEKGVGWGWFALCSLRRNESVFIPRAH